MFRRSSQTAQVSKRKMPNKLIAGFAALSATAIIAASGLAAAATPNTNQPGNGYGGNTSAATNINLSVNNSNNNIIQVIVNVFR
jgi:hypothetical protein